MTKQTIYIKFRQLGYSDKRAEELTEMFLCFTAGYDYDINNLELNL